LPLIGGHRGANALARALASALDGVAAITTAGDLRLGFALDETPPGWRIANPERIKPVGAALLAGKPLALVEEAARADWLRAGSVQWADSLLSNPPPPAGQGSVGVVVTDRAQSADTAALVFHPPVLAVGIGCERGCSAEEIADLSAWLRNVFGRA
jgi:cobalt-precorrin 5A hydrolase/precorrin-3B C17-methyltransferase